MTRQHHRRSAFTLVEMLVSTALIIFVMVILTQVFGYGLQALRNLRGVGDLQERLRQAATILRRDLASPHFGRESGTLNGPYLSQQRMEMYDWVPPKEGFFRILQGSALPPEGSDGDGIPSYCATDHALHFTVRMDMGAGQGTGRDRLFKTNQIPAAWMNGLGSVLSPTEMSYLTQDSDYCSRWAEIAYFLDRSGQQANGNDLFTLYRRKRVVLDSRVANKDFNISVPPAQQNPLYVGSPLDPGAPSGELQTNISEFRHPSNPHLSNSNDRRYYFNSSVDVCNPMRRFGLANKLYPRPVQLGLAVQAATTAQQVATLLGPPNPSAQHHQALANISLPVNQPYVPLNSTATFDPANQQPLQLNNGGDDILLENVLSMEIRVNWDVPTDPRMTNPQTANYTVRAPRTGVAFDEPFDILPSSPTQATGGNTNSAGNSMFAGANGPFVFDTWCGTDNYQWRGAGLSPMNIPLRIRVKAIQVRLRVWDIKTQQARQVTIVQDL